MNRLLGTRNASYMNRILSIPYTNENCYTPQKILFKSYSILAQLPRDWCVASCLLASQVMWPLLLTPANLKMPDDVMADDMGVWNNNHGDTVMFVFPQQTVKKCGPPTSQSAPTYTVKCIYHNHGINSSLKANSTAVW